MHFKSASAAVLALAGAASAQAVGIINYGAFTLTYDDTTSFSAVDFSSNSAGVMGFGWTVDPSVNVTSFGPAAAASFALPDFSINVNAGWALSGPVNGFIGNLVFNEVNGAVTTASAAGLVSVNGGPAAAFGGAPTRQATVTVPGYTGGYYLGNGSVPLGGFSSFSFSGGTLALTAGGGAFSSIVTQGQNVLSFNLVAAPVPEPETAALLVAGLLTLGTLARRRNKD